VPHGVHLGHGIALRSEHFPSVLQEGTPPVDWIELIVERFLRARGGGRFDVLETLRRDVPLALHGTRLSIAGVDPLDRAYLLELKGLVDRVQPVLVSDHLAWTSFGGSEFDLLPVPYTEEALDHVVRRVVEVQEVLGRRILLENPSAYVGFRNSSMRECDFLAAVACRADCGILLDVNNLCVSARNLAFDPREYLRALPKDRVGQIHLAGHLDMGDVLVDTHEGPVPDGVWELYRETVRVLGPTPTIVEWDTAVPTLQTLMAETRRAAAVEAEVRPEAG
jgi:uncharacterized protein